MSSLDSLNTLTDIDQLAVDGRIYVYGDGMMGAYFLDLLAAERPDVSVLGIVNSFTAGRFHDFPMVTVADFLAQADDFDAIVVTPLFWAREIATALDSVASEKVVVNMVCDCGLHSGYRPGSFDPAAHGAAEVLDMLEGPESRLDWQLLTDAMRTRNLEAVFDRYRTAKSREMHYFEYPSLVPGDVVVEGGVHTGESTRRLAAEVGPSGRVYGFDPLGERYANETLAGLTGSGGNVEIVAKALWESETRLAFVDDGAGTITTESADAGGGESVEAISVDAFADERGLERVDFIKLDVEGAEPKVLRGAARTIRERRPALAISIYHDIEQYFEIPLYLKSALSDYRFDLGYYSPDGLTAVLYARPTERVRA